MPADRFGSDRRERTTKQITFDTAEEIYNLRENKQSRWTLRWPGQLQMLHSCRWMDVARLRDATPTWRALWGRRTRPSAAKSAFSASEVSESIEKSYDEATAIKWEERQSLALRCKLITEDEHLKGIVHTKSTTLSRVTNDRKRLCVL